MIAKPSAPDQRRQLQDVTNNHSGLGWYTVLKELIEATLYLRLILFVAGAYIEVATKLAWAMEIKAAAEPWPQMDTSDPFAIRTWASMLLLLSLLLWIESRLSWWCEARPRLTPTRLCIDLFWMCIIVAQAAVVVKLGLRTTDQLWQNPKCEAFRMLQDITSFGTMGPSPVRMLYSKANGMEVFRVCRLSWPGRIFRWLSGMALRVKWGIIVARGVLSSR